MRGLSGGGGGGSRQLTAGRVDLALIVNSRKLPDLIIVPVFEDSVELQKRRIAAPRLLACSSLELVKSLVLDEVGVGILPRRVAEHGTHKKLRSLSPPLPLYRDRIALVRRYDVPPTAAIRVVIDGLLAHCKAIR